MRIAYVCTDPGIPVFGTKGASIHVQEMLRALLKRGSQVTLISSRLEGKKPADLSGVATIALPSVPKGDPETRARDSLDLNVWVEVALKTLGPLDLVYERHALYAYAAMEVAKTHGIPSVLEVNAPLLEEHARHRTLALAEDAESCARRATTAAGVVSAVSSVVGKHVRQMGASRIEIIPNAVTPSRFPPRLSPSGPFTLGFLGSLKPWHDVGTVIDALSYLRKDSVPDARLLIVGDGPERERFFKKAKRLGLDDAITFAGAVSPQDVPEMLSRMHVGIVPYAATEEFYFSPLKLYEYMAAGLAVIASNVGHMSEIVDHGRTGLLTPAGDAKALAETLATVATREDMRLSLGALARANVLAHHTWDKVAKRVVNLATTHPSAMV